jgi:hypothetical protein
MEPRQEEASGFEIVCQERPPTSFIGARTSNFDRLLLFVNAVSGGILARSARDVEKDFLAKCFHMAVNKECPSYDLSVLSLSGYPQHTPAMLSVPWVPAASY